jgi:hypothetical protein
MEFFLPGVVLFLVAVVIVFLVAPNITPFITALLSIIFLLFGVYTHSQMFASEYRLSTWQEGLKIYAPAVMFIIIVLFILYSITALFTGIHVPIPSMPNIELPSTNTVTNSMMNAYNNVANSVSNATNSLKNSVSNVAETVGNTIENVANTTNANKGNGNKGNGNANTKNKPNVSRSFVETI